MGENHQSPSELEPREPTLDDVLALCRWLNTAGAAYIVIGGFAMRACGYVRQTFDIDLLVAADLENERRVYEALSHLPDNAVKELLPGEIARHTVIRVADEIVVDLMKSASGIEFADAAKDIATITVEGIPIPFASPALLWRMKAHTYRAKDEPDRLFLRQWFENHGQQPPPV